MNHAGEAIPVGFPVVDYHDFASVSAPIRTLAIVGSHPKGREGIPWEDQNVDIMLFNEAPLKPEKYPRWTMALQIHTPEVYSALNNWVNPNYWPWLQESHGKPIYMHEVDPRVPDSVKYPLDEILEMIAPLHYLRSSPAMGLALGIYLGYQRIMLFGSELTSNTEYAYQATNYAFWIGFAKGRGVDLDLRCWESEFYQRIYGYEGETQLPVEYFQKCLEESTQAWRHNENAFQKAKNRLDEAMLEAQFDKVGQLSLELETIAQVAGETFGAMKEAERYCQKDSMISRQEFERNAADGQKHVEELKGKAAHEGGKVEYIWNVWRATGNGNALLQLREFLKNKTTYSYECGREYGRYRENIKYMVEYDKALEAAGGVRALGKPEEYKGTGFG